MAAQTVKKPKETAPVAEPAAPELTPQQELAERKRQQKEEKQKEKDAKKREKGLSKKGKKNKSGKGKTFALILVILVVLALGGLAAILVLNPLGIRDKYMSPVVNVINKVPFLSNVIKIEEPPAPTETPDELRAKVDSLQTQLDSSQNQVEELQKESDEKETELENLRNLESQYTDFNNMKEEFYKEVAYKDPATTEKYLKGADPDLMKEIATEISTTNLRETEVKQYLEVLSTLDAAKSAAALELLIPTDMELVILILESVDTETSSAILSEMKDENRASCIRQMRPSGF
ncbi:MAG: hypothetical protein LBM16_03185 [Clostridiales bacterium]|jgi:prefoldin subunit 5|nr:hypothetical protein [Clostridiales bacterium]